MKILVTGGMGFIGHNVVKFLTERDHNVIVMDNRTTYGFVPQSELDYLMKERGNKICPDAVYPTDIRNGSDVDHIIQQFTPELLIHCASFPRQKVVSADPVLGSQVMCTGLINLLEAAKKYQVRKFLYISSSMVYGDFETDAYEDDICNPIGQYAIMKLMGEQLVKDYSRRTGMEYTIVRPSAVYGELDVEDRVVSKFVTMAMRGETLKIKGANEVLDFSYVEDTALGIVQSALSHNTNGKIYNITRSAERIYTLKDAAELAISIAGSGKYEIQDRDLEFPSRGRLSIERARADFGYDPKVNVEEGFKKYHDWYTANPILWRR